MPQGPYKGIGGSLSRALGGPVSVTPVGGLSRNCTGIFRRNSHVLDMEGGVQVERKLPTFRASRNLISDLTEGATVDPGDGEIYEVSFVDFDSASGPALDALITLVLELK